MKFLLQLAIILVFIGVSNSYAQENSEEAAAPVTENDEKVVETAESIQLSLKDKLSKSRPRDIKISEFNPIKNRKGFITLIEFNDLSCKECLADATKIYETISAEDLPSLKIIYKHAQKDRAELVNKLAFFGFLAKDYEKFWEFKDKITNNEYKDDESIIEEFLNWGTTQKELFNKIKLRGPDFYRYIDIDTQYAELLKGHTTPMFFIDGYKVDEDISLQEMLEYIKLKKIEWLEKKEKFESKYKVGKI
ncbi:MAG: thioredoxin domain-containing protein [Proteobacteria bacterium]|nr:thioredoxin domain-containing protein [Pseudomonadota bacterium]